jgi:hypothetical protein
MSNKVLQSGSATPGHLVSWTTDGVVQDSGVTAPNLNSEFTAGLIAVNFNATNQDNAIDINLPSGYTRWRCNRILISGASGTLTTATCGVFTQTSAGGVAIVSSGTAITVNTSLIDTINNMMALLVNNGGTLAYSDTVIYFRVQNPQGVAATANVSVYYEPLP